MVVYVLPWILQMRFVNLTMLAILILSTNAVAGPPYVTDDPEPVEYRHWEFYAASEILVEKKDISGTLPHIEINYGVFPDLQLHFIVPIAFYHVDDSTRFGFGDLEAGVKLRFIHETDWLPQVGTFIMVEIPTGNAKRGLGNGATQVFIPLWLQKSWGPWTTYGGGGYGFNTAQDGQNWWYVGWQAQFSFTTLATIGAEIFYTTSHDKGGENDFSFNVGFVFDITDEHHILLSAGRAILGPVEVQGYLAYQLTVGPLPGR
jgi:hypothetical protein